ncbi:hypothetical protein H4S08_004572, partial [Coemansia sp. RSA 1365]
MRNQGPPVQGGQNPPKPTWASVVGNGIARSSVRRAAKPEILPPLLYVKAPVAIEGVPTGKLLKKHIAR